MFALQKTVIVAEDEPLVRMLAADILTDAGFTVVEAAHAEEALAALALEGGQVLALFTDVHMPGTYNGMELAQLVRKRWPRVAILITSGHYAPAQGELPEGGVFVTKPYKPEQIVSHIRSFLPAAST